MSALASSARTRCFRRRRSAQWFVPCGKSAASRRHLSITPRIGAQMSPKPLAHLRRLRRVRPRSLVHHPVPRPRRRPWTSRVSIETIYWRFNVKTLVAHISSTKRPISRPPPPVWACGAVRCNARNSWSDSKKCCGSRSGTRSPSMKRGKLLLASIWWEGKWWGGWRP